MRLILALAAILAAFALYLVLWPVPIEPVVWSPPIFQGYTGDHVVNDKLANLTHIDLGAEEGPEHVALGPDGKLYAAVLRGILRMNADGSGQEVFARTGGRVLGFAFDASGAVIAADAVKGLLSIARDGTVTLLSERCDDGSPIVYADAVIVARNGKIYFSDASTRFAPSAWGGTLPAAILDILEQSATGRLLEFDPATKRTRVVARGLSFANGVALSHDETAVFVNETGRYRVWKLLVTARNLDVASGSPAATVLLADLPGMPDNLLRGQGGKTWLGLYAPRDPIVDYMAGKPWMRKVAARLPQALLPKKAYGHVIAFTDDGRVVADLQDPSGAYPNTTGLTETADRMYVQSLHGHALGWLPHGK
jgi:sugar lactone lactonase YvrE